MNPRTKHMLISVALGAALLAAIAAARAVQDSKKADLAAPAPAAISVTTAIATRQAVPIVASGIGTVAPLASVLVRPRVDGELDRVAFKEGQDVKKGEVLAVIDPRALQAQLEQYEAQKARDEAQLANALVDLERYTHLAQQDSIPHQQLDTQRAAVSQLRATVKFDQAQVDNAKVQLDYTTLRSPISGRAGRRLVDPGNIVHAADTTGMVTINQIDPISVLFTLPEEQFQSVTAAQAATRGQPLVVQAYARTDGRLLASGELTLVNNQIDTSTGTFQLRAVFPNAPHALWPGQYVNVRIVLRDMPDAVTVPDAAIQRGPQGLFAYVLKDEGTVAAQPIAIAQSDGGRSIVTKGVNAGEHVVVAGQYKLRPGMKVVEAKAG